MAISRFRIWLVATLVLSAGSGFLQAWDSVRAPCRHLRCRRQASGAGASFSDLSKRSFLISTECATGRRSDALAGLKDVCSPQVRVFERDVADGARGCYFSHLSVYEEMIEQGLPWAVIFEDNVMVLSAADLGITLESLEKWMTLAKSWKIVHLSLVHSAASLKLHRDEALSPDNPDMSILRVERTAPDWYGPVKVDRAPGLGTTAYGISREAALALLKRHADEGYLKPIDDLLADPCHCHAFPNELAGCSQQQRPILGTTVKRDRQCQAASNLSGSYGRAAFGVN